MTRPRGPLATALLFGFGTLLGLVTLEAGARLVAIREERRQGRLERDLTSGQAPGAGAAVTLGQIIRRSQNPRIVYELRPRLDVLFGGARLTTSDAGHRGRDVPSPKPANTYRIVGIGDSYMFGQGVSDDETYLARLPVLLKDSWSDRSVETVNLAVPGFNTVMEVELLRDRISRFAPDLILIEIVGNDLDLPNFLWNTVDPWTPGRSYLLDFIRGRLVARNDLRGAATQLTEAPRETGGAADTFSRSADHVPARYASMVGLAPFEKAMADLAEVGRARQIPVLALTHGVWFEDALVKSLSDNGIPALVLRSALRQKARGLGARDYARSPLALSQSDLHPSALGHEAIALEMAAWLKTRITL